MKTFIFSLGLVLLSYIRGCAQDPYEHGVPFYPIPGINHHYIDIQYIEINRNNYLLKEIKTYIREQTDSSALFSSGFGFIIVDNIQLGEPSLASLNGGKGGEQTEQVRFRLGTRSYLLTQSWVTSAGHCTGCFPDFYSIVDGRLVLFYTTQTRWLHQGYFSESSKAKLIALQKECLKQALNTGFVYTDLFGKKSQLSTQERSLLTEQDLILKASLTLQSTKTVIQFVDGKVRYQY